MKTPYYQDNAVTIYHGSCMDILPELQPVDLVLTDPPYGIGGSVSKKNNYASFNDTEDAVNVLVHFVLEWAGSSRVVLTPGQQMMFNYPKPTAVGVFYYPAGVGRYSWGFNCWTPIFYYGKDPYLADGKGCLAASYSSTEPSEDNGHPCPKPISSWKWLLNRASRLGETIIDPFMGSGTTLRAAKDLGRKAICIEIEEEYCEIAVKRMAQEVMF